MAFKIVGLYADLFVKKKSYDEGMTDAQKVAKVTSGVLDSLAVTARRAAVALGGAVLFRDAMSMEKSMAGIRTALRYTGQDAAGLTKEYYELARAMSELTGRSMQEYMAQIKMAIGFGITREKMQATMQAAEGAATFFTTSLEQGLRGVTQAEYGYYLMTQRRLATLRGIKDPLEKYKELMRIIGLGWQQAQMESTTRSLGTLKTSIINLVREGIMSLLPALKSLVEGLRSILTPLALWVRAHPQLTTAILGTVTALLILNPIIGFVRMSLVLLVGSMHLLLSPAGLVIATFAVLAGALLYCISPSGTLGDKMEWLTGKFTKFLDLVGKGFAILKPNFDLIVSGFLGLISAITIAVMYLETTVQRALLQLELSARRAYELMRIINPMFGLVTTGSKAPLGVRSATDIKAELNQLPDPFEIWKKVYQDMIDAYMGKKPSGVPAGPTVSGPLGELPFIGGAAKPAHKGKSEFSTQYTNLVDLRFLNPAATKDDRLFQATQHSGEVLEDIRDTLHDMSAAPGALE